ncbi:MAG: hypothetical protein IJV94_02770 [Bacilli bacterium]|nr:hypothetical protein [Bacilli bacterium]
MTDEIKNSGTLSGGSISGGSNLNASVSASGTLEKGTVNTFTKELDPTVPEYIKNLEERKINDWNSTIDNLDIICPKNTVKGESLLIDDALDYKIFETKIEGNSYQKTSEQGKNIIDLTKLNWQGSKAVSIEEVTSNTLALKVQAGAVAWANRYADITHLLSNGHYIFNTTISSDSGTNNATNSNRPFGIVGIHTMEKGTATTIEKYEMGISETSKLALLNIDVNIDQYDYRLWFFPTDDNALEAETIFKYEKIYLAKENSFSGYEDFSPNSPSPNYPQEIKVVKGINNLMNLGSSLDEYIVMEGGSGLKIKTDISIRNFVDATFNEDSIIITKYNNSGYMWMGKQIFLEKNTDYVLSGETAKGIRIVGLNSLESGTLGTSIVYMDNENKKSPQYFNSGDYQYYFISMYPPAGAYMKNIQIEKGIIPHLSVPYGTYIKCLLTGKNILKNISNGLNQGVEMTINENGSVTILGTVTSNYSNLAVASIQGLPKGTYTFSADTMFSGGKLFIRVRYEDQTTQEWYLTSSKLSTTFTLLKNAINYRIFIGETSAGTEFNSTLFLQLEKGDKATPYEQYYETFKDINLQNSEIVKINDKADELIIDKDGNISLLKQIGKIILNGTEAWQKGSEVNNLKITNFISYAIQDKVIPETTPLSTHFRDVGNNYYNDYIGINITWQGAIRLKVAENISTLNDFISWLSSNPVTVYYELAEPYLINLGNIKNIDINSNINNIFIISNLFTNIETTYALDIKKYTDKKIAELTNAIVSTGANL